MPAASTDAVFVGVDTHADTHHAAVVDHLGRHLGDREFPADPAGYRSLLDWICSSGAVTGRFSVKVPEPTERSWGGF
jgi:transposase